MNEYKTELSAQEIKESIDLRPGLEQVLHLIKQAKYPRDCTKILHQLPSLVFKEGLTEEETNIAIAGIEAKKAQLLGRGAVTETPKEWSPSDVLKAMKKIRDTNTRDWQERAAGDRHEDKED
jgi:hypothetical protein